MIIHPDVVTDELVLRSILEASKKKPLRAVARLWFDPFGEGWRRRSFTQAHTVPRGRRSSGSTDSSPDAGCRPSGKHHETT